MSFGSRSYRWFVSRTMLTRLLVVGGFLIASFAWTSAANPTRAQQAALRPLTPDTVPKVVDYNLHARLDPETKEVHGKGTIVFRNPSTKPSRSLFFHLYLNAFESEETLFLREEASRSGQLRGEPGKITVHSLKSSSFGDENLWPAGAHTPGDAKDRTDIRVRLPRALKGGEKIKLHVEFTSKLPQLVERTGWERDFFLVAQWFPKLAKREPSGKWAHFPFHPNGEFYADFGDYDVTLEVPQGFIVGSTGTLTKLKPQAPGTQSYRARAHGVHDFAWTAWPGFESETREIEGVLTTVLGPPHTPRVREKTWRTLESGLRYLGEAYGSYPHPTLTVVQPPRYAYRAGGMEYPLFITTGGSEAFSYLGIRDIELLTIHELAHQWFQGMIASNEMAHPFLDEGLTSYAESRYLEDTYGAGALLSLPGLTISRTAGARYTNLRHPGSRPIASAASTFDSFSAIGSLVYARSALCLETLRRVYGPERMDEVFAVYSERYRFRHPKPQDFYDTFGEVLDSNVQTQVELMFEHQGDVDLEVSAIKTARQGRIFHSQIRLEQSGSLSFPTTLRALFVDGTSRTISLAPWNGTHALDLSHQAPIRLVEVDPDHQIVLDANLENNRRTPKGRFPDRDQQFHSALAMASWALSWLSL